MGSHYIDTTNRVVSTKPQITENPVQLYIYMYISGQIIIFHQPRTALRLPEYFTNLDFPEIRGPISLPKRYLL